MSQVSINIDAILFAVIHIYMKGSVGFIDFVKESVSRDKLLPPSLAVVIVKSWRK
jgi:hypothetical protein